jgi:hypothetical protein
MQDSQSNSDPMHGEKSPFFNRSKVDACEDTKPQMAPISQMREEGHEPVDTAKFIAMALNPDTPLPFPICEIGAIGGPLSPACADTAHPCITPQSALH